MQKLPSPRGLPSQNLQFNETAQGDHVTSKTLKLCLWGWLSNKRERFWVSGAEPLWGSKPSHEERISVLLRASLLQQLCLY